MSGVWGRWVLAAVSKETQTSNNMLLLLFLIAISVSSNQAEKCKLESILGGGRGALHHWQCHEL